MKRHLTLVYLSLILLSCSRNEKDMAGAYIKSPSINTIDSLYLYADTLQPTDVLNRKVYKYTQRFYNKKTNQLLFQNDATWWINDNGRLQLDNLYLDIADQNTDDYSYSKERMRNALMYCSLPIEGDKIIVDTDRQVFYTKVK